MNNPIDGQIKLNSLVYIQQDRYICIAIMVIQIKLFLEDNKVLQVPKTIQPLKYFFASSHGNMISLFDLFFPSLQTNK